MMGRLPPPLGELNDNLPHETEDHLAEAVVRRRGSCPGAWCNNDEAIVITGGAGSIELPSRLAA